MKASTLVPTDSHREDPWTSCPSETDRLWGQEPFLGEAALLRVPGCGSRCPLCVAGLKPTLELQTLPPLCNHPHAQGGTLLTSEPVQCERVLI